MTGEMYHIDQNGKDDSGNVWEVHAAIAEAVGGELKPFDQYQGPYIVVGKDLTAGLRPYDIPVQHLGIIRLWVVADEDIGLRIYREDTDELSSIAFPWNATALAVEAAESILREKGDHS